MNNALEFKDRIYARCSEVLDQKLSELNRAFAESREDLLSESKSTAGDKHETGRAMIQLEQEKMSHQLQETQRLQNLLRRVNWNKEFSEAQSGALVETSKGHFFIAVALGPVDIDSKKIFVTAPTSPLIQAMLGKKQQEHFIFRGQKIEILNIF